MNSTLLYIHFNFSSIMSFLLPVVGVYVINFINYYLFYLDLSWLHYIVITTLLLFMLFFGNL